MKLLPMLHPPDSYLEHTKGVCMHTGITPSCRYSTIQTLWELHVSVQRLPVCNPKLGCVNPPWWGCADLADLDPDLDQRLEALKARRTSLQAATASARLQRRRSDGFFGLVTPPRMQELRPPLV